MSMFDLLKSDSETKARLGKLHTAHGDVETPVFMRGLYGVGGFNPAVIAGEEPELCVRLRQAGWKIHRLDAEMTLHDAAMTSWRQWWKREQPRAAFICREAIGTISGRKNGLAAERKSPATLIWRPCRCTFGKGPSFRSVQ